MGASVAGDAARPPEEEVHAAALRGGQGVEVACVDEAVVGAVGADQRALEGGKGVGDALEIEVGAIEGRFGELGVAGVGVQGASTASSWPVMPISTGFSLNSGT